MELCQVHGLAKRATPAYSSSSHGRVERLIETVRWSLDRCEDVPQDEDEYRTLLYTIENSIRNTVMTRNGGGSASVRATGRISSVILQPEEQEGDCLKSGHQAVVRLQEVQEAASKAYMESRCSRALAEILRAAPRPTPRPLVAGEAVKFRRPAEISGRKSQWLHPAIVIGTVLEGNEPRAIHLDFGGVAITASPHDVQPLLRSGEAFRQ